MLDARCSMLGAIRQVAICSWDFSRPPYSGIGVTVVPVGDGLDRLVQSPRWTDKPVSRNAGTQTKLALQVRKRDVCIPQRRIVMSWKTVAVGTRVACVAGFLYILFASGPRTCMADSFELSFSTYLGGSGKANGARAVAVDGQGNIYISGGTSSPNFPTTPGAYDRTFDGSGTSAGNSGPMAAFVTKLSPSGQMIWSTLVGGPNHDRTYAIQVDSQGSVYIAGRAGEFFPTTPGAVQPNFGGDTNPNVGYGKQDGFITKLSADGSQVLWSTYLGTQDGSFIRDMTIDDQGNVYVSMNGLSVASPYVTAGAFQTTHGGNMDGFVGKISANGSSVVWGSYLGGSGKDIAPSIRLDSTGHVLVDGSTGSADFPVTPGAYQQTLRGSLDAFVAKFLPDGSDLVYATYLGGSGDDGAAGKHGLAVDVAVADAPVLVVVLQDRAAVVAFAVQYQALVVGA
ncbi:hypothetical protein LCGC14_1965330, partial [marine sediment metagenome]